MVLAVANSPVAAWFASLEDSVTLSIGGVALTGDVSHLIVNDGLMTVFFVVVGLEVKRERVYGAFRDPKKALPLFAALGGMLMPAPSTGPPVG